MSRAADVGDHRPVAQVTGAAGPALAPGPGEPGRGFHPARYIGLGYGVGGQRRPTGEDFAKLGTGLAHPAEHL
jgi:hypothetical protein